MTVAQASELTLLAASILNTDSTNVDLSLASADAAKTSADSNARLSTFLLFASRKSVSVAYDDSPYALVKGDLISISAVVQGDEIVVQIPLPGCGVVPVMRYSIGVEGTQKSLESAQAVRDILPVGSTLDSPSSPCPSPSGAVRASIQIEPEAGRIAKRSRHARYVSSPTPACSWTRIVPQYFNWPLTLMYSEDLTVCNIPAYESDTLTLELGAIHVQESAKADFLEPGPYGEFMRNNVADACVPVWPIGYYYYAAQQDYLTPIDVHIPPTSNWGLAGPTAQVSCWTSPWN